MIILRLTGGLGNQMFQYAFGRATASRLKADLVMDVSDSTLKIHNGVELNRAFGIRENVATESDMRAVLDWQRPEIIRKVIRKSGLVSAFLKHCVEEPRFHFSPEMLNVQDDVYLSGYWQSEQYFSGITDDIRREFMFRQPLSGLNKTLVADISHGNEVAISLHVRRGDYVSNSAISQVHGICSPDYYQTAIRYIAERVQSPRFYIFSDDMDWVRDHLEIPLNQVLVTHNRGNSSYEDMRLMSLCRHHIIANSSFSWWGAWLNPDPGKIVVAPRNWFSDESYLHDLFPHGWVVL